MVIRQVTEMLGTEKDGVCGSNFMEIWHLSPWGLAQVVKGLGWVYGGSRLKSQWRPKKKKKTTYQKKEKKEKEI